MFGIGTTLRYTPTLSGVKEDVILDAYRGQNTFAFTLSTGSLSVFEENGQYFIAGSAESEEKILISETWVCDSADHFEKGTIAVTPVKTGLYLLTVGASVDFLTDESTVYPVYIDPTLTVSYSDGDNYIEDVSVYSGKPTTKHGSQNTVTVGKHASYGTGRTAVRLTGLYESDQFQLLSASSIDSVIFSIYRQSNTDTGVTFSLHPINNASWTEEEATWNNIGNYSQTASASCTPAANRLTSFDITELARDWKLTDSGHIYTAEQGFMMISSDETIANRFFSSENSSYANKPYISMTFSEEDSVVYIPRKTTVTLNSGTEEAVTWISTNSEIATVDENGTLYAEKYGATTVVASDSAGDTVKTFSITVIPPNGFYSLKNVDVNLQLSISGLRFETTTNLPDGRNCVVEALGATNGHKWYFRHVGDGYFTICSTVKPIGSDSYAYYLGFELETAEVVLKTGTITDTMKWKVAGYEDGSYTIASRRGGNSASLSYDPDNGNQCIVESKSLAGTKARWVVLDSPDINQSDTNKVSVWRRDVKIYLENFTSDDTLFSAACNDAITQWNNVLPIEITVTTNEEEADIKLYGVTAATYYETFKEEWVDEYASGATNDYEEQKMFVGIAWFNENEYVQVRELKKAEVYVRLELVETDQNEDIEMDLATTVHSTAVHELGHALGYEGHSPYIEDIMYAGVTDRTNSLLTSEEIQYLRQFYEYFY